MLLESGGEVIPPAPPVPEITTDISNPDAGVTINWGDLSGGCEDGTVRTYRTDGTTGPEGPYYLIDERSVSETGFVDTTADFGDDIIDINKVYYYKTSRVCDGIESDLSGAGIGCLIRLRIDLDDFNCNKGKLYFNACPPCDEDEETDCTVEIWSVITLSGDGDIPVIPDDYGPFHSQDCDDMNGIEAIIPACDTVRYILRRKCDNGVDPPVYTGWTPALLTGGAPCQGILWYLQTNYCVQPPEEERGGWKSVEAALAASIAWNLSHVDCEPAGTWTVQDVTTLNPGDPGYTPSSIAGQPYAYYTIVRNGTPKSVLYVYSYEPPACP